MRSPARKSLDGWLDFIGTEHPKNVLGGLDRVADVARRANLNPPAPLNFIVAGTNGKGSTSVFLEQLLLASGRTVGTTLSPHIERFNERIRVNGEEAADEEVVEAFEVVETARETTRLNYFEYAILAAFQVFRTHLLDATVLEVGLGGRLDATNVVDADVAVIVSIGLEHQDYLGDTVDAIGAEKAGVMRTRTPVVFGESSAPPSVLQRARELDAPLYIYASHFHQRIDRGVWHVELASGRSLRVDAMPRVAPQNAAAACQAFALVEPDLDADAVAAACARAALPGRVERITANGRSWIVDVAHNPHAASFLAGAIDPGSTPGVRSRVGCAIVGMLQDKDHVGVVDALRDRVDSWIVTDNRMPRGLAAHELSARLRGVVRHSVAPDLGNAMSLACSTTRTNDVILIFGSFDLVGRARAILIRAE